VLEEVSGLAAHSRLGDGVPLSRLRHDTGPQAGAFGMSSELNV
jgi:hypothetical protein